MPGLQNSIYAPTPIAVAQGGTGNTTPTFSTGPLTVSTVGYRTVNGGAVTPAYSFTNDTNLGIYRVTTDVLGIACNGKKVGEFSQSPTDGTFAVYSGGIPFVGFRSDSNDNKSRIFYESSINFGDAIVIGENGEITLPQGPLTLDAAQVLAPNGSAAAPTYSFTGSTNTGIWNNSNEVNISSNGINIARFINSGGNIRAFQIDGGSNGFDISVNDTTDIVSIVYGGTNAITINTSAEVTIEQKLTVDGNEIVTGDLQVNGTLALSNPLEIEAGGTNAITAAAGIKNLMPAATVNGTIAYYNGTNWVILAPPAAGTYFLKITSGGTGTGGTPFWSLT